MDDTVKPDELRLEHREANADTDGEMDGPLKSEEHAQQIMPASLRAMSETEREVMERRIVRKVDSVVLPIM